MTATEPTTFRVRAVGNGESAYSEAASGTADTGFMHTTDSGGTDVYGLSIASYDSTGVNIQWTQNNGYEYTVKIHTPGSNPDDPALWEGSLTNFVTGLSSPTVLTD